MKKIFFLTALTALIFTTSCSSEYSVEVAYSVGKSTWNGSLGDMAKVEIYIATLGVPTSYVTFTGTGNSESRAIENADAQATAVANGWVARFNRDDITALGLSPYTYFVWGVSRYADLGDPNGEVITIAKFEWNMD